MPPAAALSPDPCPDPQARPSGSHWRGPIWLLTLPARAQFPLPRRAGGRRRPLLRRGAAGRRIMTSAPRRANPPASPVEGGARFSPDPDLLGDGARPPPAVACAGFSFAYERQPRLGSVCASGLRLVIPRPERSGPHRPWPDVSLIRGGVQRPMRVVLMGSPDSTEISAAGEHYRVDIVV